MSKIAFSSAGLWALGVLTLSLSHGCVQMEHRFAQPGEPYAQEASVHDQTPPEAHEILSKQPQAAGTGIFVVPAPDVGPLEFTVKMVPSLTYEECVRRGFHCPVFKFIPEKLTGFSELLESAESCVGVSCSRIQGYTRCLAPCACHFGTCASISARDLAISLESDSD